MLELSGEAALDNNALRERVPPLQGGSASPQDDAKAIAEGTRWCSAWKTLCCYTISLKAYRCVGQIRRCG